MGAGADKRVVLVLDRAGYHTSAEVVSDGIEPAHLPAHLPAHSPERQPAGRPWSLIDEGMANSLSADLAELEEVPVLRGARRAARTGRAHTRYHWWLEVA